MVGFNIEGKVFVVPVLANVAGNVEINPLLLLEGGLLNRNGIYVFALTNNILFGGIPCKSAFVPDVKLGGDTVDFVGVCEVIAY